MSEQANSDSMQDARTRALIVIALLMTGALLYVAQTAFIPVAIALFLSTLLTPAVDALHRWRIPRVLASLAVAFVVLSALAGAISAVWGPAQDWIDHAPQTLHKIDQRLRPLRASIMKWQRISDRADTIIQAAPTAGHKAAVVATEVTTGASSAEAIAMTRSGLEALTVIPLTLFFMMGGPPLMARLGTSLTGHEFSARAVRLVEAIRNEIGRYFATVAMINLGLGTATALALYLLHMTNPILWGCLAAVLNFVPYLGPLATFSILAVAALVTFNDLAHALAVPAVFLVLHLLEGQIVQPLTVGHRLSVNALAILLAVWFGYWFWGVPGVLLAVPSLVALKVVSEHEPSWQLVRNFIAPNAPWAPKSFGHLARIEALKTHAFTARNARQASKDRAA